MIAYSTGIQVLLLSLLLDPSPKLLTTRRVVAVNQSAARVQINRPMNQSTKSTPTNQNTTHPRPSPLFHGVRHQSAFHEVRVTVPHLRLHQVLPLDGGRDRRRSCRARIAASPRITISEPRAPSMAKTQPGGLQKLPAQIHPKSCVLVVFLFRLLRIVFDADSRRASLQWSASRGQDGGVQQQQGPNVGQNVQH